MFNFFRRSHTKHNSMTMQEVIERSFDKVSDYVDTVNEAFEFGVKSLGLKGWSLDYMTNLSVVACTSPNGPKVIEFSTILAVMVWDCGLYRVSVTPNLVNKMDSIESFMRYIVFHECGHALDRDVNPTFCDQLEDYFTMSESVASKGMRFGQKMAAGRTPDNIPIDDLTRMMKKIYKLTRRYMNHPIELFADNVASNLLDKYNRR